MNNIKVKLPASLRKHVREKKSEIRRQFGDDSKQMSEFLGWVEKKKKQKLDRIRESL